MKIFVFFSPIILFLIFLFIKIFFPGIYLSLIQEDSVIEYMQAIFYLMSSILSCIISIKFLRNKMTLDGVLYSILTIGLLLISLEEISWGQRIFNIKTPDYFKQNSVQNEISLHNFNVVQPILNKICVLVGAYGAFTWIFIYSLIPKAKAKYHHIVNFLVPNWFISSYFFFTFFIYTLFYIVKPHQGSFLLWRDQEPMELLLSLGFLFFLVTNYLRLRKYLTGNSSGRTKGACC